MTIGFLKELLRRAAMYAAEDATGQGPGTTADRGDAQGGPLTVRDTHMNAALGEYSTPAISSPGSCSADTQPTARPHPPTRPRPDTEAGDLAGRSCR